MTTAFGNRRRYERATIASIAIHALVALAIPALAWTTAAGAPVETISFSHVLHIRLIPERTTVSRPRAMAPQHNITPRITFTPNVHLATRPANQRASAQRSIATDAPAAPAVAPVQRAGTSNGSGTAAQDATPAPPVRAVASIGTHQSGGYLPFGAEQPTPVLDPNVRKELDALGVHVTLVVTVGDDGRTQTVVFQPPLDPQSETRIRSLLADANWDPAVCGGGVSCQGLATIKL